MKTIAVATADKLGGASWPKPIYAWYAVILLCLAYAVSFVDRYMLTLLVKPVSADLHLNDTQIGLLQGLAFALFYTVMGLPIGRLADRFSRRLICSAGIFIWSLMTALCGLATSFWSLFLPRLGVGFGEASLIPGGLSLISDSFPSEKRSRPISVFMIGVPIGAGMALVISGAVIGALNAAGPADLPLLGVLQPWQMAFIVIGLPGILISLLLLTVAEPLRHGLSKGQQPPTIPIRDVAAFIAGRRSYFACHFGGMIGSAITINAFATWAPTYLIRVHGWSPQRVGSHYGPVIAVCASIGILGGGWLADRMRRGGSTTANLRVVSIAAFCAAAAAILSSAPTGVGVTVALLGIYNVFTGIPYAISTAALLEVTPNPIRGQILAVNMVVFSMIGLIVGPVAVGALTDHVFKDPLAVGYSLGIVGGIASSASGLLMWLALKPFERARRDVPAM